MKSNAKAQARYRERYPDKGPAYYQKFKAEHPTHTLNVMRAWRRAHPKEAAFQNQKVTAKHRGIPFLFTFEEWVEWWGDDFALRGRKGHELVMARNGDIGPYAIGNVTKTTASKNCKDRQARWLSLVLLKT